MRLLLTSAGIKNATIEDALLDLLGPRVSPSGRTPAREPGPLGQCSPDGPLPGHVAGRLRHAAASSADLPAVGDWVAVAARPGERAGTVQAVLPRRTKFSRKTAWQASEEQVLAANVDVVFIVTSLNEELNLRRLERYLTLGWESGARPVLVLTKADLADDVPAAKSPLSTRAVRMPRSAASRAMPAPVIPPPMTSRSIGSAAIALRAAARVTWDRAESGIGSLYRRWCATFLVADRLES